MRELMKLLVDNDYNPIGPDYNHGFFVGFKPRNTEDEIYGFCSNGTLLKNIIRRPFYVNVEHGYSSSIEDRWPNLPEMPEHVFRRMFDIRDMSLSLRGYLSFLPDEDMRAFSTLQASAYFAHKYLEALQ